MKACFFHFAAGPALAVLLGAATGLAAAEEAAPASPAAGVPEAQKLFREDIEFLLDELPKHAGHFFAQKGIDWDAVKREFREEAGKVRSNEEHLKLCNRLLARLRDGHARLTDLKVKWPDESNGRRWTGPRVHLLAAGDTVYVRTAFGPALSAGVKPGQEVVAIDGTPASRWLEEKVAKMRDEAGYSTDHQALYAACHWGLADWEGTPIQFALRDPGVERVQTTTITRRGGPNFAPFGPAVMPEGLKTIGRQSYGRTKGGFGYIHLRDVPGNLPEQLDAMLAEIGDARGLILDMRANGGGGCDHDAVMSRFRPVADTPNGQSSGNALKPFTGPMVVIYDAGVRSAGETIGGMFKEDGRAYSIGDTPTAGSSSQKATLPLPGGLFSAYFSVHSNKARYNGGKGIEGVGIAPAERVPYNPDELFRGIDSQIRRAEELLTTGFPKGVVPYEPPSPPADPTPEGATPAPEGAHSIPGLHREIRLLQKRIEELEKKMEAANQAAPGSAGAASGENSGTG